MTRPTNPREALKAWRYHVELTQKQAAARMGLSQQMLQAIEAGKRFPSRAAQRRIRAATRISLEAWQKLRELEAVS